MVSDMGPAAVRMKASAHVMHALLTELNNTPNYNTFRGFWGKSRGDLVTHVQRDWKSCVKSGWWIMAGPL